LSKLFTTNDQDKEKIFWPMHINGAAMNNLGIHTDPSKMIVTPRKKTPILIAFTRFYTIAG